MTALRNLLIALALLWAVPADAAARFWVPAPVSGAISGTAGVCRMTVPGTNGYVTGNTVTVASVTGATGCNVTTTITVVDGTHIELDGSTFGGAYVSGGLVSSGNWTATNTANWAATTGSTTVNQTVPGAADTITLDGSSGGGTVTLNTNISATSLTTGAFTGTIDYGANSNTVALGTFSGSGNGTRTYAFGSTPGTWTLTGTANSFIMGTTTGLTLTPTAGKWTAPLVFTRTTTTAGTIQTGALNYASITINANTSRGGWSFTTSGTVTTDTLTVAAPNDIEFTSGGTNVFTNAPTFTGTDASNTIGISASTYGSAITLQSANAITGSFMAIRDVTFAMSGANATFTSSFDRGKNTITGGGTLSITGPTSGSGGRIIGG